MIKELSKKRILLILLAYPIYTVIFRMFWIETDSMFVPNSLIAYLISCIYIMYIVKKVGIKKYIKRNHKITKLI